MNLAQYQSGLSDLVDRIQAILSEMNFRLKMERIERMYDIGKEIISHPLYRKFSKGNSDVLLDVAKATGISTREIHSCVKFAEKYPKLNTKTGTSFGEALNEMIPQGKTPTWTNVKAILPSNPECDHSETEDQVITIDTIKCLKCNKRLK